MCDLFEALSSSEKILVYVKVRNCLEFSAAGDPIASLIKLLK